MYIYLIEEANGDWEDEGSTTYVLTHHKKFDQKQFEHDIQLSREEVAGKTRTGKQKRTSHLKFAEFVSLLVDKYGYKHVEDYPIAYN